MRDNKTSAMSAWYKLETHDSGLTNLVDELDISSLRKRTEHSCSGSASPKPGEGKRTTLISLVMTQWR